MSSQSNELSRDETSTATYKEIRKVLDGPRYLLIIKLPLFFIVIVLYIIYKILQLILLHFPYLCYNAAKISIQFFVKICFYTIIICQSLVTITQQWITQFFKTKLLPMVIFIFDDVFLAVVKQIPWIVSLVLRTATRYYLLYIITPVSTLINCAFDILSKTSTYVFIQLKTPCIRLWQISTKIMSVLIFDYIWPFSYSVTIILVTNIYSHGLLPLYRIRGEILQMTYRSFYEFICFILKHISLVIEYLSHEFEIISYRLRHVLYTLCSAIHYHVELPTILVIKYIVPMVWHGLYRLVLIITETMIYILEQLYFIGKAIYSHVLDVLITFCSIIYIHILKPLVRVIRYIAPVIWYKLKQLATDIIALIQHIYQRLWHALSVIYIQFIKPTQQLISEVMRILWQILYQSALSISQIEPYIRDYVVNICNIVYVQCRTICVQVITDVPIICGEIYRPTSNFIWHTSSVIHRSLYQDILPSLGHMLSAIRISVVDMFMLLTTVVAAVRTMIGATILTVSSTWRTIGLILRNNNDA